MLERVFPGASELAGRMRAFDWSSSDLGPPECWPDTLRVAVNLCVASPVPVHVWWGPRLTVFYNDAAIPFVGRDKHPAVLGRPALECWPDLRGAIEPLLDRVFANGEATWPGDAPLSLDLTRVRDKDNAAVAFSPIVGASGRVEGLFGHVQLTAPAAAPPAADAPMDTKRGRDELLAAVAQELCNPLAPIRSALDVMRLAGGNAAIVLEARQTIERQFALLMRLVDDLLKGSVKARITPPPDAPPTYRAGIASP